MTTERKPESGNPDEMDSPTRREFMKVAGLGALGMAYMHPVVDTMGCRCPPGDPQDGSVPGEPGGGCESSSSNDHSSNSSSGWPGGHRGQGPSQEAV